MNNQQNSDQHQTLADELRELEKERTRQSVTL